MRTKTYSVLQSSGATKDIILHTFKEGNSLLSLGLEISRLVEILDVLVKCLTQKARISDNLYLTLPREHTGQLVQLSRERSLPGSTVSTKTKYERFKQHNANR